MNSWWANATQAEKDARNDKRRSEYVRKPKRSSAEKLALTQARALRERARVIFRKYGIDAAAYDELARAQGEACAICGRKERSTFRGKTRRLSVDHDHADGCVRGLLCHQCNAGLGHFEDDIELMLRAIRYLQLS